MIDCYLEDPIFLGDVHGQLDCLYRLVARLPPKRHLVFLGDLNDRGPDSLGVLRYVHFLTTMDQATVVMGNHDYKLLRYLKGSNIKASHGLQETIDQIERTTQPAEREALKNWIEGFPYKLEGPSWIAVHGGYEAGDVSPGKQKSINLYGETTGRTVEGGYPERIYDWRLRLPAGHKAIIHGHDYQPGHISTWIGEDGQEVWNVDSGSGQGFSLTALAWPERVVYSEAC